MIIAISGTPGTGKTFLSKKLSKTLKYKYIDVKRLITKHKLSEGYDKKRHSKIVDERKLSKFLIKIIKDSKDNIIIDSHMVHFIPKRYIDLCIITRTDLKVLEKRLKRKRYNKAKIRENLDAEIFEICLSEAKKLKHTILVIDTSKRLNISSLATTLRVSGNGNKQPSKRVKR